MSSGNDVNLIKKLNAFEIQCITGNFVKNEVYIDPEVYRDSSDYELIKELDILMKNIANHDYRKILETEYKCLEPFKEVCKDFTLVFYEKCSRMKSNYQYLFHPNGENCPYVKQLILLLVGVAALQEFIRINISGPFVPCQTAYLICAEFLPDSHFSKDSVLDALARDGEIILAKLSHPKLLYLSLILLFGNNFNKCLTHKWWLIRCLMIHQKCLPETIIGLHKSIISLISKQSRMNFLINREEMLAEVMFYIECAQVHLYYSEINIAKRYLVSAQNVLGIGIKFNVAFNKKIDSKESFVTVKRNDERYKSNFLSHSCVYPPIHIQCDTANRDFDFFDPDGNKLVELLPEEQMVLLTYCDVFQCGEGCQLSDEDVIMLKTLLAQPKIWAFQVKALFQLCKKRKTAETFKSQVLEFFKLKEQEIPLFSSRQNFIFCALPPLNFELYELLLDAIDNPVEALALCEQHHLWDKALAFYRTKTYMKRGIKTLEEHIAVKPSSLLWCYLGNICSKTEMYNVAWDLSRHTNARSQRCLGYYYTVDKKYHKSIDHYKQSLQVNPLQPKVLQIIGYNAMVYVNWDLAIEIFKRILELDDCNFGVWNSLTHAHIKRGQKIDACRSFLEVQCNGNNLNVDSYILLCSQIGAFRNVIGFYKSKIESVTSGLSLNFTDVEVFQTLTDAVLTKTPDSSDISFLALKDNVNYLFEHLIDVMVPNIKIWEMYCIFLCGTTNIHTNVKTLKTVLSLRHKIISYSLKRLDLKTEKFESLLQSVICYIEIAKSYVSHSKPSGSSKFRVIIKTKSLLDRFLHDVKDIPNQFELPRNIKESLSIILEHTKDVFNWSDVPLEESSESS